MKSVVSEKGQVTIPKALRTKLGLEPGTVLDFKARNGTLVARKHIDEDVITKWRGRGRLPHGLDVDAYLRQTRG